MPWRPATRGVGSANWAPRSKRQAIQSLVAPARGIDHRTCAEKRFSIASNSRPALSGAVAARAGARHRVMDATPPLQSSRSGRSARASTMSFSWLMLVPDLIPMVQARAYQFRRVSKHTERGGYAAAANQVAGLDAAAARSSRIFDVQFGSYSVSCWYGSGLLGFERFNSMRAEDFSAWLSRIAGLSAAAAAGSPCRRSAGGETGKREIPRREIRRRAKRRRAASAAAVARTHSEQPVTSASRPKAVRIARAARSSAGVARTDFCGFAARVAGAHSTR